MPFMSSSTAAWALAASLASACALLQRLSLRRMQARSDEERERLLRDNEGLRDEIWELKEAEAARDRAEAENEAKSRFLATVSHEIRTPLTGILGMANLLAATPLGDEQRNYLDAISTSGAALASLIDEILDFSKIEAGKLDIVESEFDPFALVEGVVELLAPRAQGKGLEIAASIDPATPRRVVSDPARIRQVLINLAGNAVKFTERGGVGVRLSMGPAGLVRFSVADTGIGIPEESRSKIFQDFVQADGSVGRRHEGAGLGLAISRRIVEKLGGELILESSSPEGSVFSFSIFVRQSESGEETRAGPSLQLTGRRALIVGSSPFEAPFMGERLADAGASVTRALDLDGALAALKRSSPPDIVIIDCALGEEATREVAAAAREAGVSKRLVLFSPFERRAFGHNLDCVDGWLVKPVRSRSLSARLQERPSFEPAPAHAFPQDASASLGLRVLLAEDNPINALIARKHLERLGVDVLHVTDGGRAVEAFAASLNGSCAPFDLILMDLRMPGLGGLDAARRIRDAERLAQVQRVTLVAFTANAFDEDRAACQAVGFDDFLTKPIDFEKLGALLLRLAETTARRDRDKFGDSISESWAQSAS